MTSRLDNIRIGLEEQARLETEAEKIHLPRQNQGGGGDVSITGSTGLINVMCSTAVPAYSLAKITSYLSSSSAYVIQQASADETGEDSVIVETAIDALTVGKARAFGIGLVKGGEGETIVVGNRVGLDQNDWGIRVDSDGAWLVVGSETIDSDTVYHCRFVGDKETAGSSSATLKCYRVTGAGGGTGGNEYPCIEVEWTGSWTTVGGASSKTAVIGGDSGTQLSVNDILLGLDDPVGGKLPATPIDYAYYYG